MTTTLHDFETSKAVGSAPAVQAIVDQALRALHGGDIEIARLKQRATQAAGRDIAVHLPGGDPLYYDEKFDQYDNARVVLEYMSDEARKSPGWVCKPLRIHGIIYVKPVCVPPTVHIWPFDLLRRAWQLKGEEWKACAADRNNPHFRAVRARNVQGFTTLGVALDIRHVEYALRLASTFRAESAA